MGVKCFIDNEGGKTIEREPTDSPASSSSSSSSPLPFSAPRTPPPASFFSFFLSVRLPFSRARSSIFSYFSFSSAAFFS